MPGPRSTDGFLRTRATALPFEEVVTRLKAAIEAADLWVLHEIDPQALLRRGGFDIPPARQLLFFHPRYMVRLLSAAPSAVLEAPLKFATLEADQEVVVRWFDPGAAFGRYDSDALKALGVELSTLREAIAAQALGEPA